MHLCSLGACTEKGWLEFGIYASRTPGTHLSLSFPTDSLMVSGQLAEQRCLPYFRAWYLVWYSGLSTVGWSGVCCLLHCLKDAWQSSGSSSHSSGNCLRSAVPFWSIPRDKSNRKDPLSPRGGFLVQLFVLAGCSNPMHSKAAFCCPAGIDNCYQSWLYSQGQAKAKLMVVLKTWGQEVLYVTFWLHQCIRVPF